MHGFPPTSSRILARRERERIRKIHEKKLRAINARKPGHRLLGARMDPGFDNAPPKTVGLRHLASNPKKQRMMEERYDEIERQNKLLLARMTKIMSSKGTFRKTIEVPPPGPRSLNRAVRRKEVLRIYAENEKLVGRINSVEPAYSVKQWEEDFRRNAAIIESLSNFYPDEYGSGSILAAKTQTPSAGDATQQDAKMHAELASAQPHALDLLPVRSASTTPGQLRSGARGGTSNSPRSTKKPRGFSARQRRVPRPPKRSRSAGRVRRSGGRGGAFASSAAAPSSSPKRRLGPARSGKKPEGVAKNKNRNGVTPQDAPARAPACNPGADTPRSTDSNAESAPPVSVAEAAGADVAGEQPSQALTSPEKAVPRQKYAHASPAGAEALSSGLLQATPVRHASGVAAPEKEPEEDIREEQLESAPSPSGSAEQNDSEQQKQQDQQEEQKEHPTNDGGDQDVEDPTANASLHVLQQTTHVPPDDGIERRWDQGYAFTANEFAEYYGETWKEYWDAAAAYIPEESGASAPAEQDEVWRPPQGSLQSLPPGWELKPGMRLEGFSFPGEYDTLAEALVAADAKGVVRGINCIANGKYVILRSVSSIVADSSCSAFEAPKVGRARRTSVSASLRNQIAQLVIMIAGADAHSVRIAELLRSLAEDSAVKSHLASHPQLQVLSEAGDISSALANWEAVTDGELTVHEFGEFICNSPDLVRCVVARGFDIMEPGHEGKILKRKFLRDITTHPEVCQIFGRYKPLKPLLRPQTFEKAFLALDCDHDGYATIDELTTFACGRAS